MHIGSLLAFSGVRISVYVEDSGFRVRGARGGSSRVPGVASGTPKARTLKRMPPPEGRDPTVSATRPRGSILEVA